MQTVLMKYIDVFNTKLRKSMKVDPVKLNVVETIMKEDETSVVRLGAQTLATCRDE